MNKSGVRIISAILILALAALSCNLPLSRLPAPKAELPTGTLTLTPEPEHEIYAGFTENKAMPFVMIHKSGESLVVTQDPNSSTMTGVVWTSAEGQSFVILADADGRPKSAVMGDDVLLYSNYTNDTVDVTIVHADGTRETVPAKLDSELLKKIKSYDPAPFSLVTHKMPGLESPDIWAYLQFGMYLVSAAACMGIGGTGVGLGMAVACAGFLISSAIRVADLYHLDIGPLKNLKNVLNMARCALVVGGGMAACVSIILTEAETLWKKGKAIYDELEKQAIKPNQAKGTPGDAGLQIATIEFEPLLTGTPTPTATLTPTATSTSTPEPVSSLRGTVLDRSSCRYGPGAPYLYMYGLKPGLRMEAIGRDADGNWLNIRAIGGNNPCWLKASLINMEGDVMQLPDNYTETLHRPISPYFEAITLLSVSGSETVNVEWQNHVIRADLDSEQGIEYIIEVWTCVDGKPAFYAVGFPPGTTSGSFTVDSSCGVSSRADIRGMDKEGFSPWTKISLP